MTGRGFPASGLEAPYLVIRCKLGATIADYLLISINLLWRDPYSLGWTSRTARIPWELFDTKRQRLLQWDYLISLPIGFERVAEDELNERCEQLEILWRGVGAFHFLSSTAPQKLIGNGGLRSVHRVMAYIHNGTIGKSKAEADALVQLPSKLNWVRASILGFAYYLSFGPLCPIVSTSFKDRPCELFNALCPDKPNALTAKEELSFRVTGFRQAYDGYKQEFSSEQLAKEFGSGVHEHLHWKPKMNGYELEIIVDVHNEQLWIGIALRDYSEGVRLSLTTFLDSNKVHSKHAVQGKRNRSALGETTLQSSLAYGLIRSCDILPGHIILDPLGGVGTICIEGAQVFPSAHFITGDITKKYVESAVANIKEFVPTGNCDAIVWDSTDLPFPDSSIDVVVTDLPFGHRHSSFNQNQTLYPKVVLEFARILKKGGRMVLLTTEKGIMRRTLDVPRIAPHWDALEPLHVDVGGFRADVYKLIRK